MLGRQRRPAAIVLLNLLVAAGYLLGGYAGMWLAAPQEYATVVWPPAGIAVAAVLLAGRAVLPGVFAGALLVEVWLLYTVGHFSAPYPTLTLAALIAAAATLQAALSGFLVHRRLGREFRLIRDREILAFFLLAGPLNCLTNSTLSTLLLTATQVIPKDSSLLAWATWWGGDVIGVIIFAPLLLTLFGRPRDFWRPRRLTVGLPLFVGSLLTVAMFLFANNQERLRQREEFLQSSTAIQYAVNGTVSSWEATLDALRGFFYSEPTVSREQFRLFANSILAQQPWIKALSWNPVVNDSERQAFTRAMAAQYPNSGFRITEMNADGKLVTAARRNRYTVVGYIEPLAANHIALGYDLSANPERNRALQRAIVSGAAAATTPVRLVQQPDNLGTLIFLPIYRDHELRPPAGDPEGHTRGFVTLVIDAPKVIDLTLARFPYNRPNTQLWSKNSAGDWLLLYQNPPSAAPDTLSRETEYPLHFHLPISFAGIDWELLLYSRSAIPYHSWETLLVLASGLSLTALLGGFLLVISGRNLLTEALVEQRTGELARVNTELAEQERNYRTLFNTGRELMLVFDPADGAIWDVSSSIEAILGYSAAEARGMQVYAFCADTPDYNRERARVWQERALTDGPQFFEWRWRRRDGSTFPSEVELIATTIGGKRRLHASVRDVTKRQEAERLLRLSEQKFATAFRMSPDAVNINRLEDGCYLEINDGFTQITGYSRAEVIGRSSLELDVWVDPADRARLVAGIRQDGIVRNLEARFRKKDGTIIVGLMSASLISVADVPCLLNITREITDRKRMEEELRKSEEELQSLMALMPVAFGWADYQGRIGYVNARFVEQFGYTLEDVPTLEAWGRLAYPDPEYRARVWTRWQEVVALATGQPAEQLEVQATCRDGGIRHIIITPYFARDRILCIFIDLTEREQLNSELIKNQRLESLGLLAGGIAHDFNNILTGLLGNLSFAKVLLPPGDPAGHALEQAEKASRRAAELARQLLTFAKGGEPIKATVAIPHLVGESMSLMLRGSNVRGSLVMADDLPPVEADEGQLNQAFNNLIINAVQAMPGGGELHIDAEALVLEGGNRFGLAAGDYVRLSFADEGHGIAEADCRKIFDPYYTTKPEGSGLGLASAHSIVARHGGAIDVASTVGKGSTFSIYLPAAGHIHARNDSLRPLAVAGRERSGLAVLVMDDEEMILETASAMLQHLGYRVTTCRRGEEAIERYRQALEEGTPFFAVVMDLTIQGGLGGKDTAPQILALDPAARLLVSSGYSSDPIMAEYAQHGFCAVIAKPYTIGELDEVLARLE